MLGRKSITDEQRESTFIALAEKQASAVAAARDSRRSENSVLTNFSLFDMDQSIKIRTYWLNMLALTLITALL